MLPTSTPPRNRTLLHQTLVTQTSKHRTAKVEKNSHTVVVLRVKADGVYTIELTSSLF